MTRARVALVLVTLLATGAGEARAGIIDGSPLALRAVGAPAPSAPLAGARDPGGAGFFRDPEAGPLLAQRAISREWGASDESTYVEIEVPEYRSEGWAMLLSGLVPGAGHFYVGATSAWLWALAEVGMWTAHTVFDRRADTRREELFRYVGSPYDASGPWSFQRWALATQGDTLSLQQLYAVDPEVFWHRVGTDDRYLEGWGGTAADSRAIYQDFEERHQNSLQHRRYAVTGIVLTHLAAALDALRAAREHNAPLERNLRFRLKGAIDPGGEAMTVAIERRF